MSPRALTAAPDDRSMWRRALAKLHPDGGGSGEDPVLDTMRRAHQAKAEADEQ